MSPREFEIPPPGKFAQMYPLLIGLVLPIVMVAIMATNAKQSSDWLAVLPALLILPLAAIFMARRMQRRTLRLIDDKLHFGLFPWRRVAVAAFDLDHAGIVNLDEHRELQPVWRIAGTAMPGYRSGWFRLRDKRRAYVVLTDLRRVLVLPKRDGGLLLFSLARPEALLDALQRATGDKIGIAG